MADGYFLLILVVRERPLNLRGGGGVVFWEKDKSHAGAHLALILLIWKYRSNLYHIVYIVRPLSNFLSDLLNGAYYM